MSSIRILEDGQWPNPTFQELNSSTVTHETETFLKAPPPSPRDSNPFMLETVFSDCLAQKMNARVSSSHGFDFSQHTRLLEKLFPSPSLIPRYHNQRNNSCGRNLKRTPYVRRSCLRHCHNSHRFCYSKRASRIPVLSARLLTSNINKKKRMTVQQPQDALIHALDQIHISDAKNYNDSDDHNDSLEGQCIELKSLNHHENCESEDLLAQNLNSMIL
ncbi:hypothetical protein BDF20DRAFT_57125 [Mycotypha africana]|uniref:uncharacterized protein n=1 Tax=Mycotypha africana TaxID=64632 RepID=UPI002300DE3A|nr:uncharacterized protein BDF20DRAFT_57125 [Mycotypha africana]KAI8991710.1 hypothetical protein BDF20DRAFT_57125 [Mycotypha africana]